MESPAFFVSLRDTHHRGIRRNSSLFALSHSFFVSLRDTHHRGIRRIFLEEYVPLRASTQEHILPGMRGSKLTRKKLLSLSWQGKGTKAQITSAVPPNLVIV